MCRMHLKFIIWLFDTLERRKCCQPYFISFFFFQILISFIMNSHFSVGLVLSLFLRSAVVYMTPPPETPTLLSKELHSHFSWVLPALNQNANELRSWPKINPKRYLFHFNIVFWPHKARLRCRAQKRLMNSGEKKWEWLEFKVVVWKMTGQIEGITMTRWTLMALSGARMSGVAILLEGKK